MNKPASLVKDGKLCIPSPDVLVFDPAAPHNNYHAQRDGRPR